MPGKNSKPSRDNGNLGEDAMGKMTLDSGPSISIWSDGASKDNHIAGAARVAGVGVVFGHPSLPHLYGPVKYNMTEKATNNAAELQAAILGLEKAKEKKYTTVELNTDSKLLENIMTKWMDRWKENNWRKLDGGPLKISIDLLKKLDDLRSKMDITWKWLPRNSCPEMVLADSLANQGCKSAIHFCIGEFEIIKTFQRTFKERKLMYPDELPPTLLRNKEDVQISPGKTVSICCSLDISDQLKHKLIESKSGIKNLTSDQAYGLITTVRTFAPMEKDGTVIAQCHTFHSTSVNGNCMNEPVKPTLIVPKGSVVGVAFSGLYGKNDEETSSITGAMFFTSRCPDYCSDSNNVKSGHWNWNSQSSISMWTNGTSKERNCIALKARLAGVGVVFGHPSLSPLYGPVEYNLTEKATNNAAELQAAILGLQQAKAYNFKIVEINTDSKLLENIMTGWMDQWKADDWKKCDEDQLKISIDLLKKLDELRSEMDISWRWLPRNSCPEMVSANALSNQACESVAEHMGGEWELNRLFRRTQYDRRMMYPDELPPTVLRNTEEVLIPAGRKTSICCSLDISDRLKQKLIVNKSEIMNVTSDQAYGLVTTLRTCDPMEQDGSVIAQCHTFTFQSSVMVDRVDASGKNERVKPTLVLPKGSVVGLAFSGLYGKHDESTNQYPGMHIFTPRSPDYNF